MSWWRIPVLAALLAGTLGAQVTASLLGTVSDETGAAVPGARVVATNVLTNETRTAETNEVGNYSLPALPVGNYTVRCEVQGFKTWVREGIELSLNRNARVDIRLALGAVTERMTVVGDAPVVETTSAEMGALVDRRRIVELPLNGRNSLSLVSLAPGAQELQTGNAQGFIENKVSINGIRAESGNWLLDGGDNTSTLRNYGNDVPNPDAVQEFRVITNNYDAEYGRSAGAIVNVITRSGTNEFHGGLFEFLRNRRLNAREFFEPDTTPLAQNQFGGTFGGPVLRNRTFFFGTYQGLVRRTQDFRNAALVPTDAERKGDFSNSVDRAGKPIIIKDPATNQPFANNLIPAGRLSPVAQNYLKLAVPQPNDPASGPNRLFQRASHPNDNDQFLVKIDHLFSTAHKLSGAYFLTDSLDGGRFLGDIDFARRDIMSRQQNLNIHEYWTISASKLNHFRATYSRNAGDRKVLPDDVSLNDLGSKFSPLPSGPRMPPVMDVRGYFNAGSAYGGAKIANHFVVADSFDWMLGRHNLKFGAEGWQRRLFDTSTNPAMGGSFTFDGAFTGNGLADLLLGQASQFRVADESYKSNNSWSFYGFFQDKFRATPKLVLNLAVRYELNTWPVHPLDQLVAYLPGRQSSCVPAAPAGIVFPCDSGVPRAGLRADHNDWAPRVGIAYDPFGNGKTVLRAGYGIYYSFTIYNALQSGQVSTPFRYDETFRRVTLEEPYAGIGGSPFPFLKDPAHLRFPPQSSYNFQEFDMRNGYIQQYDFTIQRQFSSDWSAEIAYVGNLGRKLTGTTDYNAPLRGPGATAANIDQRRPLWPTYKLMQATGGFVNSSYNSLQARVEKRFGGGFSLLGSYTAGKAIDESTWHDNRTQWADIRNRRLDRGRGAADRAQIFAMSWVWELPFASGHKGVQELLLGGWALNGILSFYAGQPITLATDRDNDYDGETANDRPDVIGDWKLSPNRSRAEVIQRWFNPAAFRANQPGQIGNTGRNIITGPGYKGLDLGVVKSFRLAESRQVQFRCETFNAPNWVNLAAPEARLSRATFGQILRAPGSRVFQFGLKFLF